MRKLHPWRNDPICRIDVTGLLSIMVVFLAIFLAPVYSFVDMPHNSVSLPHASHLIYLNDADRDDSMMVSVSLDGRIYFDRSESSPDELPAQIQDAVHHGSRPTVFLSVDHRAKYATVNSALDAIHSAGITRIAIVAESR